MTVPTTAELALLRSHPQATKLYLSIYQPTYAMACQLSGTATKGMMEISYDGVTTGSYTRINSGMTVWVGTTPGGFDKGTVRVRSATASKLTVAENSHINWADNDYLTVTNFYEINAVYPRIIQDPADDETTLWYKDYDVVYNGQNSALGSFICMGSHYAGFKDDAVYYSASGTLNLKSETLSYHWLFEGGTPTGSSSMTPGNVTYAMPGHYTTQLIVSGTSAGAVDKSYRHISIYERPEAGTKVPILNWELQNLSGSRDQAGYTADIRIFQNIPESLLREGSMIVIFADDWYGDLVTKQSIGGNTLGRSKIVFVGYVMKGGILYNYRDSYVNIIVGSPTEVMRVAEGFSCSVEHSNDPETATSDPDIPSGWVTVLDMDIKRAIYHYLRWHSTVMNCCDFQLIGTDRPLQYFDADRTSLFDAINTLLKGAWFGSLVCDRQGKLFAERDIYLEPTAFPTTFTLSKQDWLDDVNVENSMQGTTSFVELGGVAFSGHTGTYTALLSQAPGTSPGYRGKVIRQQGLALLSQTELNNIAGLFHAQQNASYPNVDIKLAGNYRNFDIAPQEKIPLTITPSDTIRNISFTNKPFYLNRMDWRYDSRTEIFLPNISLGEICTGTAGTTITIPAIPPSEGYNNNPDVPEFVFPTFPVIAVGATFNWSFIMGLGAGIVGMVEVPFLCQITSVKLVSDTTGNAVVDLWKCTYADIDNSTHPVVGDSIIGTGDKPTLVTGYKTDTNLAGWTTTIMNLGDWLYIYIESMDVDLMTLSISGTVY